MSFTDRPTVALLTGLLLLAVPCLAGGVADEEPSGIPTTRVQLLAIEGPMASRDAEISSMTWQGDTLVILPQFPDMFAEEDMLGFFVIDKETILKAIDGDSTAPIKPAQVFCKAPGLAGIVRGFDGLEAMGVIGDRYFMTVEAKDDTVMAGFLVSGSFSRGAGMVVLDLNRMQSIPLGMNLHNVAVESIVIDNQRVIAIGEANGRNINPTPHAMVFNENGDLTGYLPMPQIEYRVTDASALDSERRFWVINYFFPPERAKLKPAPDPELARFGDPASYDPEACVERLIELRLTADDRIVRTVTPPLNLELLPDGECRNWEALVRLDDRGFLLMTDKYPGTLLAFVPYPN